MRLDAGCVWKYFPKRSCRDTCLVLLSKPGISKANLHTCVIGYIKYTFSYKSCRISVGIARESQAINITMLANFSSFLNCRCSFHTRSAISKTFNPSFRPNSTDRAMQWLSRSSSSMWLIQLWQCKCVIILSSCIISRCPNGSYTNTIVC